MTETTHSIDLEKLPVRALRQRMFNRRSKALFGSDYTFVDDAPEQIEQLEDFTNWESFSESWDILWIGLDPRTLQWVSGRHNSPIRQTVLPLRIVRLDDRTKRMEVTAKDKQDIKAIEVPVKEPIPETEEDRIISESLSGRVVIDEPDEDKAIRLITDNMKQLQAQLDVLLKRK